LKTSVHKVLRQLKGSDFRWAYLGEDVSRAIAIEQQLMDRGQRIEIAEELQKVAQSLRQPYINYIGKLSLKNNSILWWIGSLSEKNNWVSKTFLYACYIRLFQTVLNSSGQETLIFFSENKALRKCLVKNAPDPHKWEILYFESLAHTILGTLRNALGIIIHKGYFVLNYTYRLLLARYYRLNQIPGKKLPEGKGFILIHNWVDQRSFDADGGYHDSYLGGLAYHLRDKGRNVIIAPGILSTVSYNQTLKKMVRSGENFLAPESFLKISDIFRTLVKTTINHPPKRVYPRFESIDVSEIIDDDFRNDWQGTRTALSLLLYEVVKRWKNARIPIDTFIYPYENHVWEKAYCIALRRFYPSTKIVGYQHATVPKMLLNHFFSKDELPILPFPDKVITSGKYFERLFKESGFPPEKVICGGAIRYAGLVNRGKKSSRKKDTSSKPVILVTPSIDKNEAVELVWKVLQAFGQTDKYKIILKFHPVMPYTNITRALGLLPKHFIISDKPVSDLLKKADILLYTYSATSIESLSLGVPVLHVGSEFMIDLNTSDFPPGIRRSAKSKDDILKMTEEILKTDGKGLSEQREMWQDTVADIFGPVDESMFDLFL